MISIVTHVISTVVRRVRPQEPSTGQPSTSSLIFEPPAGRRGRTRVALVTIIPEEFDAARDVFGLTQHLAETPYFVADATAEVFDVALMQATDRTNVPVMGDVSMLMEDLRPQIVILVGIAGGLCDSKAVGRDDIQPGDVLIADQVSYVEFLKLVPGGPPLMRTYPIDHPSVFLRKTVGIPVQKTFSVNEHLGDLLPPDNRKINIHIGGIVSGEKVLGDVKSHIQEGLLKPFDKALAVDMESIGMARAICDGRSSFWYHPRYAIIRGISDLVSDSENDNQRASWKPFAAQTAAIVAREFVRRLPKDPGHE